MKKVVVIGGGFAGSRIAKSLEDEFEVTLVDTKNYFEFTPSILSAITDPTAVDNIQIMHTHYLKKANLVVGKAEKITKDYVLVNGEKVGFDYLVISSGSHYNFPFKDHDTLIAHRANKLRAHYTDLHNSRKVLIIGGGLSGVELAAEIATKYDDKRITIIHAMNRLIERQPERASRYAQKFLQRRRVRIIFNELVQGSKKVKGEDEYFTNKGTKIKSDISFLCVGIKPNSDFIKKSFPNLVSKRGYIATNKFLQLKGFSHIFVGGDVTDIKEEKTAQVSLEHAKVIVENIKNLEGKKHLKPYSYKMKAMLMSLGKDDGILVYKKFMITGIIARIIKRHVQNKEMRWLER